MRQDSAVTTSLAARNNQGSQTWVNDQPRARLGWPPGPRGLALASATGLPDGLLPALVEQRLARLLCLLYRLRGAALAGSIVRLGPHRLYGAQAPPAWAGRPLARAAGHTLG